MATISNKTKSQINEATKLFIDGLKNSTWDFHTDWGFNIPGRYMGLMMDKWVGPMYEKGLGNLKQLADNEYIINSKGIGCRSLPATNLSNA